MDEHPEGGGGYRRRSDTHLGREPTAAFAVFALMAKQAERAERVSTGFQQARQSLLEDHAADPLVVSAVWVLEDAEARAVELARALKNGAGRGKKRVPGLRAYCPDPNVVAFADATPGLGDAVLFFLGLLPQWVADFKTVSKLWAYCGLHVLPEGRAPKKGDLNGGGTKGDWSPYLKAIAILRLADPCVKCRTSPYRPVYDARRACTAAAHPDWTDMHAHRDAMRVTAKAILKDLWRVSRNHLPVFGGNRVLCATQNGFEPTEHPAPPNGGGGQQGRDTRVRPAPAANPSEEL